MVCSRYFQILLFISSFCSFEEDCLSKQQFLAFPFFQQYLVRELIALLPEPSIRNEICSTIREKMFIFRGEMEIERKSDRDREERDREIEM